MKILYITLSLFCLLFSLHYFSRLKGKGAGFAAVFIALLPLLFSLLTGAYLIADWFTGMGFDDSVFYHLRFGVEGAGLGEFIPQFILFILIQLVGVGVVLLYLRARRKVAPTAYRVKNTLFGLFLLFCAFFINPALQSLLGYFNTLQARADFPLYFHPAVALESVERPKNVLYFYLEGLERTYLDPALFPGLLPNLARLEKSSISFTQIDQTIGASWTVAGMVASQCGLPLLSVFTNNDFSMNEFMPNVRCLGDLLKQQGYRLEYMGGAKSEFAGKGLFYQNHGFERVAGREELLEQIKDPTYINDWGVHDDTLYDLLAERFALLGQQSQPFALFSINIGTHQPEGHIARACEGIRYADGSNRLLNAAHCTDRLLGQLLDRLQQQPALKNTLIVLASDHLAPPTVITRQQLERGERKNLLMIIDPDRPPASIDRRGTTLDIAPTLLGYLHYGSRSLALGRDLNGSELTLSEAFSAGDELRARLLSWRTAIDEMFWGYPPMPAEIIVHPGDDEIQLTNKRIHYPALIVYEETGKISEVWYSNPKARAMTPAFYLAYALSNSQPFLWVDSCAQIHSLVPELRSEKEAFCYYSGSLAGSAPSYGQLPTAVGSIPLNSTPLAELSVSRANQLRNKLMTTNLIEWSDIDIQEPEVPPLLPTTLASAGRLSINGPSFLSTLELTEPGLYLVRMNYRRDTDKGFLDFGELLTPLDLCREGAEKFSIAELMERQPGEPGHNSLFYAIIGNGGESCQGGESQTPIDLPLKMLDQLKAGMPYIAVFDRQRRVAYEKLGDSWQTIGAYVNTNLQ